MTTTGQRPSQTLNLEEWCEHEFGDSRFAWWASWQFDNAVLYVGRWIENRLQELDRKGKPRYTIEMLLADDSRKRVTRSMFAELASMKGISIIKA